MKETLLNMALAIGILGASALITHLFARAMYITCPNCHTLNARRRIRCRNCSTALPTRTGPSA
jgi:ribosomal protein S27E